MANSTPQSITVTVLKQVMKVVVREEIQKLSTEIESKAEQRDQSLRNDFFNNKDPLVKIAVQEALEDYDERNQSRHSQLMGAVVDVQGRLVKIEDEQTVGAYQQVRNTKRIERLEKKVFGKIQSQIN